MSNNNNNNNNLYIFSKYINNKYKLIPFNMRELYIGDIRYTPPVSKEWKNTIYAFNQNNIKDLPANDLNLNLLIKNYFNLYFNGIFLKNKKHSNKRKSPFNKIHVSKPEIKHTNNKALITVYVYNREKLSLLKKIKLLKNSFFKKICLLISNTQNLGSIEEELILLRRYKLKLNLNLYKFEEKLLFKLKNLIMRYYSKKVEFNLVNLKSIVFNSEFFTKIIGLKLKKRNIYLKNAMLSILNKVSLPKSIIGERILSTKSVNFSLLLNKYIKKDLITILKEDSNNFSQFLNKFYYNVLEKNFLEKKDNFINEVSEIIFNSIKYKNMGGIRFEAKGRLTRRHRADRSVFRVRWKGGLRNIESSYNGLSTINIRNYVKPNIEYSIFTSKRHVGAFAVKGWISGK